MINVTANGYLKSLFWQLLAVSKTTKVSG